MHGNSSADSHGNEVYEGEWEEDLMHGQGVYQFTSGAVYTGQWIKGEFLVDLSFLCALSLKIMNFKEREANFEGV